MSFTGTICTESQLVFLSYRPLTPEVVSILSHGKQALNLLGLCAGRVGLGVGCFVMCANIPLILRPIQVGVTTGAFGNYQSDVQFCNMDNLLISYRSYDFLHMIYVYLWLTD